MSTTTARERPALEDIGARTMTGDVRDFLLNHVRHMQKPWPQMNEAEQRAFIDATERQAESIVRKAVALVGSQGFESFEISVGDFSKKGNRLEAKLTAPYSRETLADLAEAGEAGPIVLSLASMEAFRGQRAPAKPMADQPDLMEEADQAEHDEDGVVLDPGDEAANDLLSRAIEDENGELGPVGDGGTAGTPEDEELGPEAQANTALLNAGIGQLETATTDEPVEAAPGGGTGGSPTEQVILEDDAAPRKRGRRSTEQRIAETNAALAAGEPAKGGRRSPPATATE